MQCRGDDLKVLIPPLQCVGIAGMNHQTRFLICLFIYFVIDEMVLFNVHLIVCVWVWVLCVCKHRYPWKPEAGPGSFKTSIRDGFESLNMVLRPNWWAISPGPYLLFNLIFLMVCVCGGWHIHVSAGTQVVRIRSSSQIPWSCSCLWLWAKSHGFREPNSGPLQEPCILSATGPSLQPPFLYLRKKKCCYWKTESCI